MNGVVTAVNTPGWCYAIAYWLSCQIIILTNNKRLKRWALVLVDVLFLMALLSFMIATDHRPVIFFFPSMIVCIFLIFGCIYSCCKIRFANGIYCCVRTFIMGEFVASFEWQMGYFFTNRTDESPEWLINIVLPFTIYSVVISIFYLLEKKSKKGNQEIQIKPKNLFSVILIGIVVFMISNVSYVFQNSPFSSQFTSEIFIIRTLVDLGGVAILYAYNLQLGEMQSQLEVQQLQGMLSMQQNNYEMLEQSVAAVNQKYHDLKYQISVIKSETDSKKSMEYLNQMERDIKSYEAQNKTGNKILDTILTGKSLSCQANWIELTAVADGAVLDFMDPIDISTLFGNALDNAIECAEKISDKKRRLIHLTVTRNKGFVRIRIENCYDDELLFDKGIPTTTKKDKEYHGYGLKSIRNTVQKYNGSVTINTENQWFELRILIPIPDKKDNID